MKACDKLGIVIVNYNGSDLTIDCVNSLNNSSYTNFFVYIVDNGSRVEEVKKLEKFCSHQDHINLIDTRKNYGIAKGNNIGITAALDDKCDYIMLLNNDTVVDRRMIEILMNQAVTGTKLCTPLMFYFDTPNKIWCGGGKFNKYKGTTEHFYEDEFIEQVSLKKMDVEYVPTCCLLFDKSLFEEYGLFDEKYFLYYDDTDYIYKLNKEGYKIKFLPDAKLWHKVSSSSGGSESKLSIYYGNRNRLYFISKHFKGVAKLLPLFYTFVTRVIKILNPNYRKPIFTAFKDYYRGQMGWKDMDKM